MSTPTFCLRQVSSVLLLLWSGPSPGNPDSSPTPSPWCPPRCWPWDARLAPVSGNGVCWSDIPAALSPPLGIFVLPIPVYIFCVKFPLFGAPVWLSWLSVDYLLLAQVMISWFMSLSPASGSVLIAWSLLGIHFSLSLSLCLKNK